MAFRLERGQDSYKIIVEGNKITDIKAEDRFGINISFDQETHLDMFLQAHKKEPNVRLVTFEVCDEFIYYVKSLKGSATKDEKKSGAQWYANLSWNKKLSSPKKLSTPSSSDGVGLPKGVKALSLHFDEEWFRVLMAAIVKGSARVQQITGRDGSTTPNNSASASPVSSTSNSPATSRRNSLDNS